MWRPTFICYKKMKTSRKSGGSGGSSTTDDRRKKGLQGGQEAMLTDTSMISMVEFDPAHREMAVDVPESFVARTKTPPRYPPPKHATHHNNNNHSSKKRGSGGSSGSETPLNGTLTRQQESTQSPVLVQSPNSQDEENRLKKYQDELRIRRERDEQAAMLRNSLRSSQKLQSLAVSQPTVPVQGVDNQAFSNEELTSEDSTSSPSPRINELIQSLQRIQSVLQSNGHRINEDVTLVAQLLNNADFQKVLSVHNKIQQWWCAKPPPLPVQDDVETLVAEVLQEVQSSSSPDASELVDLLNKFAVEGAIYAHDRVALKKPNPASDTELPEEASIDEHSTHHNNPSVKIVRIDKTNEPLGATIRNEGESVVIGRIVKGGAAEKSGKLHEGDEILEVNGVEMRAKCVNDVCEMLSGMTGTLTFIIIPGNFPPTTTQEQPRSPTTFPQTVHVKAHFDYDPDDDIYIPCRELGMSFQKGDILHVLSQADPSWWQAYREGEEDQTLAGLIPSKAFQSQREAMRQTVVDASNKEKTKKGKQLLCAKKHQKKKKKMLYSNYNDDFENEEILTYEEVTLYYPHAKCKRPVVLIGPPNIGRHELRQKLMEDRDRFAAAVPHTSRPRRDKEVDGQDYHFISRAEFEEDILQRRFVEHGEFEKAYYGTSLSAIRSIVSQGKICVLNLHALSLKILKNSDLKPFVVFVAPPNIEKLRQKKQKMGEVVKDEELKEIMEKAREMEDQYGHYFDLIIINQDVETAYQQLLHEINMLEREPQWVPASWLLNE